MHLLPNLLVGGMGIALQCSKKTDIKAIQQRIFMFFKFHA